MLHDYLATLDGYVEEEIDHSESSRTEKTGGVSKVLQGSITSEQSTESSSKRRLTEPAKFERLYRILKDLEQIQYLEAFDQEIWDSIKRGEILEVQASLSVPTFLNQASQIQEFAKLTDLITAFSPEIIQEPDRKMLSGFGEISNSLREKPVPIVFQAVGTKQFNFTGELQRDFLNCTISELQGEATVFGKVQRILGKGEKAEVFSIVPDISAFEGANRKERRRMQSTKSKANYQNLKEVVKGPAIFLSPLAVYR